MSEGLNKIEKVKEIVSDLENKKSKFIFFMPDAGETIGVSVYEIYRHATTLKNAGFEVIIMTEKTNYEKPTWFETEIMDIDHVSMEKNALKIRAIDFLVVPDHATWFMESIKKQGDLPCAKVVFIQTIDVALNSLLPSMGFTDFDFYDAITTSEKLTSFYQKLMPRVNYKEVKVGIPDYFKPSEAPKKPIFIVMGRNVNDLTNKIAKVFFLKYPHLQWVPFQVMGNLSRQEVAEKLGESVCAVWVDRIAGFGTFPLEAMKSGALLIGLVPDNAMDYIQDNSGVWTNNIYEIADAMAQVIEHSFQDTIPQVMYDKMKEISDEYTIEKADETILSTYNQLISERVELFKSQVEGL